MTLREFLLDAKKAVGCAVLMAGTAATAGVLSGSLAAEIVSVGGVLSTGLVYLLSNVEPVGDDTGPGTTEPDADVDEVTA